MGQVHARSWIANAPRGVIAAVTDVSAARAQALADEHTAGEARVHPDIEALTADPNLDAVDICLPHHLHADAIARAARAGKHVLCEKPLCLSFEEARAIKRAIDAAGVTLTCAHNNLFALPLIEARRLIGEGVLGKLYFVQSNEIGRNMGIRTGRAPVPLAAGESSMAWRLDPTRMGGAELLDTGWHGVYRLIALADARPTEVAAMVGNHFLHELLPGEDSATLLVRFANGVQGVLVTSWAFGHEPGGWQFQVAGAHGTLAGNVTRLVHAAHGWPTAAERTWETRHSETYAREVTHFLDVVLDGAVPQAAWEHGARTLQVIRAGYLAAQERRIVALPEDPTEL
jgi:predicted dehydrogenase